VTAGTTVNLSPRRAFLGRVLALVLIWTCLPALASPSDSCGDSVNAPFAASSRSCITHQALAPSVSFAKKSNKGGGGSSGNSGKDEEDKKDEGKKDEGKKDEGKKDKDKKNKDGKKDEGKKDKDKKDKDKKNKDGKKDEGKKDKDKKNKDKKNKDGKKDEGKKDEGKKDEGEKDEGKKDEGRKDEGKKDEGEKDEGKKDEGKKDEGKKDEGEKDEGEKDESKKDEGEKDEGKKDEGEKDDKEDKDGDESGDRDEQEPDDDQDDNDRNERHDHDNGVADDKHDHETEEERQGNDGGEESGEGGVEQGERHERDAGDAVSSDQGALTGGTESSSSSVPGVVTLSWMPPTENEDGSPLVDLEGYRIYWRHTSAADIESMKIDNPGLSTIVIDNLEAGTYEFSMTSFNGEGVESEPSNTITRVVEYGVTSTSNADSVEEVPEAEPASTGAEPFLMISGTPPEAVIAGNLYLFTPDLDSSGESPPVFMIEGLPYWAGFNEINGELYGAPADEDIGFYAAITISATDGVVETSLPSFSIEVVAPGAAPGAVTLSWMPPTENEDGSYLVDLAGYWIYWGNNPGQYTQWMRIDNPGLTAVVIESLVPGTWEFAMTSFNAAGVESDLSNTVTRFVD
jgi:hypothetical protein